MKDYLTIGEVAKLKDVSIKSLRYYDRIGIFKPSYTNEATKYRYYTFQQLVIVDIIKYMIHLDMPLKNFDNYVDEENRFNLKQLSEDGKKLIAKKIKALKQAEHDISLLEKQVAFHERVKNSNHEMVVDYEERYFLIEPIKLEDINRIRITKLLARLYDEQEKKGYSPTFYEGVMKIKDKDSYAYYVFTEIEKPDLLDHDIMVCPPASYQCSSHEDDAFKTIFTTHFAFETDSELAMIREMRDVNIDYNQVSFEIQKQI